MRVRFLFCLIAVAVLAGCGGKKNAAGEEGKTVTVGEFLKTFPPIKGPHLFSDSVLLKKSSDSLHLRLSAWKQLIPDSVYTRYFKGQEGLRLYAVGKVEDKDKRRYALVKAVSASGLTGYLFYFDKSNKYGGGMRLVEADDDNRTRSYSKLDNRLNVSLVTETRKPGGFTAVTESIYGLSDEGGFSL